MGDVCQPGTRSQNQFNGVGARTLSAERHCLKERGNISTVTDGMKISQTVSSNIIHAAINSVEYSDDTECSWSLWQLSSLHCYGTSYLNLPCGNLAKGFA